MWQPLSSRLTSLPIILAGPILRRVEPEQVTVWLALKESRTVTLSIYPFSGPPQTPLMTGSRKATKLGTNLYIAAVTAVPPQSGSNLTAGNVYTYDLSFASGENLTSLGVAKDLTYGTSTLPTFSLPPASLDDLHLIHGSCRKPHGPKGDALVKLDQLIDSAAKAPTEAQFASSRPHQLWLTGDQIYADDVADALLKMLTDAGDTLLGWEEVLPDTEDPQAPFGDRKAKELAPGTRQNLVEEKAKLTSGEARSHLLGLGEFYAMYLFAWSPALWPASSGDLPDIDHEDQLSSLVDFHSSLPAARRALANAPTYMIFDDHEVTDDWFINRRWCMENVPAGEPGGILETPLGQRLILNGLLAYAVFQAWGNTPEQFEPGTSGEELLTAASLWSEVEADDSAATGNSDMPMGADVQAVLEARLGLPTAALKAGESELQRAQTNVLRWHYRIALTGTSFEVIALDTRTMRSYPAEPDTAGAGPLSDTALQTQIDAHPSRSGDRITFVIAPAPVLLFPTLEGAQRMVAVSLQVPLLYWLVRPGTYTLDVESWGQQQHCFNALLARLAARRDRVIILSGDVHWGFAATVRYWAAHPYQSQQPKQIASLFVQLTSSGVRNTSPVMPSLFHHAGFTPSLRRLLQTHVGGEVAGWNNPQGQGITVGTDAPFDGFAFGKPQPFEIRETPALVALPAPGGTIFSSAEEWRYRIDWLEGKRPPTALAPFLLAPVGAVRISLFHLHLFDWIRERFGEDYVGANNLAEITFDWPVPSAQPTLFQDLWWREELSKPFIATRYEVSLAPEAKPKAVNAP